MSRKVALLVTAEVMTRIVVEVADDFDVENLNENEFTSIADMAKPKLIENLRNDYYDCVDTIELDKECPYNEETEVTPSEIRKTLKDNDLYCEVYEHANGCISIEIEWGDWKHEHGLCDHLMKQMGYICTDEKVTEENGSDTYSAIHFYEKVEEK